MPKRYLPIILLLVCYFTNASHSIAQNSILKTTIQVKLENDDLASAIEKIEAASTITFAYASDILPKDKNYTFNAPAITLKNLLKYLLKDTGLVYEVFDGQIILKRQQYFEVYGIIRDEKTKEALTAATVYIENKNIGVTTNNYGYYSLKLREGAHNLVFSYLGMISKKKAVNLYHRQRIDITLEPEEIKLQEVIVKKPIQSEDLANAPLNQQSMFELSNSTPQVGGEPDLLHVVRAQAGVHSSAGGIGGLYVRGGNTGHNLVLLDGVPVYNWMHLLGINSIFNPSAVRGVQFYTSGFSARYGGRLSSVIDIQSKDGNPEKISGMAGINPRSFHGHISGPLLNENGTFWIGGRRSFITPYVKNVLIDAFYREENAFLNPKYYDINIKASQRFGLNDRVYFSFYKGNDEIFGENLFDLEDDHLEVAENNLSYGNQIYSLRWNHIYGKHMFSNLTINSSEFFNDFSHLNFIEDEQGEQFDFIFSNINSSNAEQSVKLDFDWINQKHHIKFGGSVHNHLFDPFFTIIDDESEFIPEFDTLNIQTLTDSLRSFGVPEITTFQTAFYVEDEIHLTDNINARLGLRFSSFNGPDSDYRHLEPRFLLSVKPADDWLVSGSFSKMVQYLHLISNSDIGLPRDLWLPTDDFYEPSVAWHYNLNIQHKVNEHWQLKSSTFYKTMDDLVLPPDSLAPVDYGIDASGQLLIGNAESWGSEFSAFGEYNKLKTFVAYTLSWATREFEQINENTPFPFQFDSRHYLQLLLTYKFNDDFQIGFRGHYSSPRPQLVAIDNNSLENGLSFQDINNPGERNQLRGDHEHRIDFNVSYYFESQIKNRPIRHRLNLELYNVYNRDNPVFNYSPSEPDGEFDFDFGMNMPLMVTLYFSSEF